MAASYDAQLARLETLPSFNVFDALGIERPTEDLSVEALLERMSLIMDLFQVPNLRPKEVRGSLFPAPWQVTAAFSFLVSFDIKSGGPGTALRINQENLALSLQEYGKPTYRRTFFPDRSHDAPGEQQRSAVWPFFNFDAFEVPHPRPPSSSSHSSVSAPATTVSRRHGLLLPRDMLWDLQEMFGRTEPPERIENAQPPQARGAELEPEYSNHRPTVGISNAEQSTGYPNNIVFRSQGPVDSSESDKEESATGDGFPIPSLAPAADANKGRDSGTYVAGIAIMVGSPKDQSQLPKSEQQLVWATFTRRHHLVFTARQENVNGETIPIDKLLRRKGGKFVTAIKLRDIDLFGPWAGLSRTALQRRVAVATWAAQLCGQDVQPLWHRKPDV